MEFKYQNRYTCNVPEKFSAFQSFSEVFATDSAPTRESIEATFKVLIERTGHKIASIDVSDDLTCGRVMIKRSKALISIFVKTRPSVVHDGIIYKLEELYA